MMESRFSISDRLRSIIPRIFSLLVFFLFLIVLLVAYDLLMTGHPWLIVGLAFAMVSGFLLYVHGRFSYIGSFFMSMATMFLVSLLIFQTYFLQNPYTFPIIVAVAESILMLVHVLTRKKAVLTKYVVLFFPIAYMITNLLAFYVEGTEAGANQWIIFSSSFAIGYLLLIPLNLSSRQHDLKAIVDISDLELYLRIARELKTTADSYVIHRSLKIYAEIDKIVSELKNAVFSFLYGYFEGSIVHSSNVMEGIDRIAYNWLKWDEKLEFLKEEKEALEDWRQHITHSNVRTPSTSTKRRKKAKREKERKKNRYLKGDKKQYEISLWALDFVLQAVTYMKEKSLAEYTRIHKSYPFRK